MIKLVTYNMKIKQYIDEKINEVLNEKFDKIEDPDRIESLEDAKEIVYKLKKKGYNNLSYNDYLDWLFGGKGYNKFDKVVADFLGKEIHNKYDDLARLDAKLRYELKMGPKIVGGTRMDLK